MHRQPITFTEKASFAVATRLREYSHIRTVNYSIICTIRNFRFPVTNSNSCHRVPSFSYFKWSSYWTLWFLPRSMSCRRGIARRILSVRPSVCLWVCHARDPWQNGREICPDVYTIRKNIYLSFLRRRMVGGGRPLLREILGQPTPLERNRRFSTNNRS